MLRSFQAAEHARIHARPVALRPVFFCANRRNRAVATRHPPGSRERVRDGFAGCRDALARAVARTARAQRASCPRDCAIRGRVRKTRCFRFATSSPAHCIALLRRRPPMPPRASRRHRLDPPSPARREIFFAGVVDIQKNRD